MNENKEELQSQKIRKKSFEGDALRMSMDWTVADLDKVQVLMESTHGSSHPSSYHLGKSSESLLLNNINHPNDYGHYLYFKAFTLFM